MAPASCRGHPCRWHCQGSSPRARHGSTLVCSSRGLWEANWNSGVAEYFIQFVRRAYRQSRRRRLSDIPAQRNGCAGCRANPGYEATLAEGRMIRKRGKIRRGLIVIGSVAGSINDLALGMWRGGATRRWLLPLAIFICLTGVLLIFAASVEALAPFIYSIF